MTHLRDIRTKPDRRKAARPVLVPHRVPRPSCGLPIRPCRSHATRSLPRVSSWSVRRLSPPSFSPVVSHSNTLPQAALRITLPQVDALAQLHASTTGHPFVRVVCRLPLLPLHRVESGRGAVVLGCSFHS